MSWYGIGNRHFGDNNPDKKTWIFLSILTLYLFCTGPLINYYNFNPYKVHFIGILFMIISLIFAIKDEDDEND